MESWWRTAQSGAALHFGARHYRKFAVLQLMVSVVRALVWALVRRGLPLAAGLGFVFLAVWLWPHLASFSVWEYLAAGGTVLAVGVLVWKFRWRLGFELGYLFRRGF